MDKVTIYRVLWSTLKLDATNRHGLADVITLEDHRRALDAERERLKGQIDYSIQLQQLIESLRRDDTPSPELYHHKIIVEFKRQLATLQAQLRQVEGERDAADAELHRDMVEYCQFAHEIAMPGTRLPEQVDDSISFGKLKDVVNAIVASRDTLRQLLEDVLHTFGYLRFHRVAGMDGLLYETHNKMSPERTVEACEKRIRATLAAQDAPHPTEERS